MKKIRPKYVVDLNLPESQEALKSHLEYTKHEYDKQIASRNAMKARQVELYLRKKLTNKEKYLTKLSKAFRNGKNSIRLTKWKFSILSPLKGLTFDEEEDILNLSVQSLEEWINDFYGPEYGLFVDNGHILYGPIMGIWLTCYLE